MALVANPNIRLVKSDDLPDGDDVQVIHADEDHDQQVLDKNGALLQIEHPDGSLTITLDGSPIQPADKRGGQWFENLVDDIGDMELGRISEELLRGIRDDIGSRKEWIEARATGMKLLGLQIEIPGLGGSVDGAPVEGISRIRHPLLLEAVLRFQANARSELLPTDGPVKIRDDGNGDTIEEDRLADDLEQDLNHYLTSTASEYYPDTDRMLLLLGFGGTAFKKVYNCPLRNRPVSETVDADDLIVNNQATDLQNARRITHRIMMRPSTVKRMQIVGAWADIELPTPMQPDLDSVQRVKKDQEGIQYTNADPEDRDREIYECHCELNISGFEHKLKGKITGLQLPYRVTIDVSSTKILSIVRNFDEDSEELPEAKEVFVKYTFVPGFGFYDIGLLHILGNTTNAVTAAWRELLDAGMYACFPGFLMADTGARQNTNVFRVPPGGGALVKTGGMPISQAILPLPYKDPSPALMQLTQEIAQTGMRIGGTSELMVGEGRPDAPVGTTLAMIEQAQKVLNSVHKRMHAAQSKEFALLLDCFRENPSAFWQRNKKPTRKWDQDTFLNALNDVDLVPQADPNTASHTQRLMKVMALKQLQGSAPALYDPIKVEMVALQAIGYNNPQQFMAPPAAQAAPPPELIQAQAQIKQGDQMAQATMITAQARMLDAQAKAKKIDAEIGGGLAGAEGSDDLKRLQIETQSKDTQAKLAVESSKIKADLMKHATKIGHEQNMDQRQAMLDLHKHQTGLAAAHRDHMIDIAAQAGEGMLDLHKHHTGLAAQRDEHQIEMQQETHRDQLNHKADLHKSELAEKSKARQNKGGKPRKDH